MSELEQAPKSAHDLFDPDSDAQPNPAESLADRLRKQHRQGREGQTLDLDIPFTGGMLFCRYRLIEGRELARIADKLTKTVKDRVERGRLAAVDTLIAACEEFFARDGDREIPIREELGLDAPVKYDSKLAEYLQFADLLPDPPTARSVVLNLFHYNDVALAAHNRDLSLWMMGRGDDGAMEGEL